MKPYILVCLLSLASVWTQAGVELAAVSFATTCSHRMNLE